MKFDGLIPSVFTNTMLVSAMAYPISVVEDAKKLRDAAKMPTSLAKNAAATSSVPELDKESIDLSPEAFQKMQKELERANVRAQELQGELSASRDELKVAKTELEMKGSEIKRLDGVVSELRKRRVTGKAL